MKFFERSLFFKQILLLLSGSVVAQAISVAFSPLLTRLYSPEAFGVFALFSALVYAITPGVTGRYDMAALVTEGLEESKKLFFLSIAFSATISFLALLAIFLVLVSGLNVDFFSRLGGLSYLIPFFIFLVGVTTSYKSWANKFEDYGLINWSIIYQNLITALFSVLFGLIWFDDIGLIFAALLGTLVSVGLLVRRYELNLLVGVATPAIDVWRVVVKYKDYPLFNASSSVVNGFMSGLPVFFIAKYFSVLEVGYYALLIKAGSLPLSAIADAISRVNLRKITSLIQSKINPLGYFYRVTAGLVALSFMPTLFLVFYAPEIMAWVFGEDWRNAGVLLSILMPALAVQFVVSTLSLSFLATGRLRLLSVWQVISLLISAIVFVFAGNSGNIETFFWCFMAKDIVLYVIYYFGLVYVISKPSLING